MSAKHTFALSLSKGWFACHLGFDRLSPNGGGGLSLNGRAGLSLGERLWCERACERCGA